MSDIFLTFKMSSDLIFDIRKGIPFKSYTIISELLNLSNKQLNTTLGTVPNTISKRRESGRLSKDESDKILRITRVYIHAVGLFEGDFNEAIQWLYEPSVALDGACSQYM